MWLKTCNFFVEPKFYLSLATCLGYVVNLVVFTQDTFLGTGCKSILSRDLAQIVKNTVTKITGGYKLIW